MNEPPPSFSPLTALQDEKTVGVGPDRDQDILEIVVPGGGRQVFEANQQFAAPRRCARQDLNGIVRIQGREGVENRRSGQRPSTRAAENGQQAGVEVRHAAARGEKGKIVGQGGIRYQLACDESRGHLATLGNDEAATDQLIAVNCPGCLKAAHDKKIADSQGLVVTG